MDEREQQNRFEALANAVRHRLREETAEDVVESAEKYLKFLHSESDNTNNLIWFQPNYDPETGSSATSMMEVAMRVRGG